MGKRAKYNITFVGEPDPERFLNALCQIFENRHKGYKFTWREKTPEEMAMGGFTQDERNEERLQLCKSEEGKSLDN